MAFKIDVYISGALPRHILKMCEMADGYKSDGYAPPAASTGLFTVSAATQAGKQRGERKCNDVFAVPLTSARRLVIIISDAAAESGRHSFHLAATKQAHQLQG